MKAVRIHEDGGPEVLRYEDAPDPEPRPGEVLVRLRAASLNHLDLWIRKGLPSVPKPRILGADGAGVVAALGPGACDQYETQRVASRTPGSSRAPVGHASTHRVQLPQSTSSGSVDSISTSVTSVPSTTQEPCRRVMRSVFFP